MAGNKYYAKFSGKELDNAVEYILKLKNEYGVSIIGSTIDTRIDLNTLTDEGVYIIHYFENSYDDTQSPKRIEFNVFSFDGDKLYQRYQYGTESVQRYYNTSDDTWSDWKLITDVMSVEQNTSIEVGKQTLVLRHYDGNASEEFNP